jgi:hypothetical protein
VLGIPSDATLTQRFREHLSHLIPEGFIISRPEISSFNIWVLQMAELSLNLREGEKSHKKQDWTW